MWMGYHNMEKEVMKCVMENNMLDNIANIATLLISFLNLIFVVLFYAKDRKEHKKEKQQNYKSSWLNMINVKERIENLNFIITETKKLSIEIFNNKEDSLEQRKLIMQSSLSTLDNLLINEKNKFSYLLKCIDQNKNKEMCKLYNEYQDEYMHVLECAVLEKNLDYSVLQDILNMITEMYYNLGINILSN